MSKESVFKRYYSLTKPGVLYGNALTAASGFLLASRGDINLWLFVSALMGTTLVIASACVINNYLDQDIDKLMARTKKRALVEGSVKGSNAVIFGTSLGVIGILILYIYTNLLVVGIGIIGFVDYVVLYGMLSKRLSYHGTLVGSVSGAAPILAGYVAAAGALDAGAVIVFAVLFLWQMPEFYSIAVYRRNEYRAANIPVITVVKGIEHTKKQIIAYTIAFVAATLALPAFGYAGYSYWVVMTLLGAYWLNHGIKGLKATDNNAWARKMFKISLIILLVFSVMISIDAWIP
ncbi:protoheme IX farnesyltransferase [Candidatus Saccharibacteria bacterium]|nr:protoheme IX farnesyltransferase [Candidatus Saccharibacteria bacterium]